MADVPPIISTPGKSSPQTKILLVLLGVLVLAGVVLGYKLYGGKLSFAPGQQSPAPQVLSSFENCEIKKDANPLIWDIIEIDATAREVDFRGKVGEITTSGDKTSLELISLDGTQYHQFLVDNTEVVYGRQNYALKDIKPFDEILLVANCIVGKKGSFRISRLNKIE